MREKSVIDKALIQENNLRSAQPPLEMIEILWFSLMKTAK